MNASPCLQAFGSADEARAGLEAVGWSLIGQGDWSWVLGDPSDAWAARVTPFDPAYRLFAQDCLAGPPNRWLPRVSEIIPLGPTGYLVLMERLWPASPERAAELCAALDIGDRPLDAHTHATLADDPELADLRDRVRALITAGERRFRLWGGSDLRPANVLADRQGSLKLIDPVFVRGREIVRALAAGDAELLAEFTRDDLEAFLTIPVFAPGPETDALRGRLANLPAARV